MYNQSTIFRMVCAPRWLNLERCKTELFRLEQGITVRLYIPATWTYQNALFYIESDQFTDDRDLIHVSWEKSKPEWISISDSFVDFTPKRNGSYRFQIRVGDEIILESYLVINPKIPNHDFNSLCIQTLLPKQMGHISNWDDVTKFTKMSGYNMIHFTPLQKLGISDRNTDKKIHVWILFFSIKAFGSVNE